MERVLVVDYNAALKDHLESRGFRWVYGDLAHPETLDHWGIGDAAFVICSISDTFLKGITNSRLLAHLKQMAPQAKLIMSAEVNQKEAILTKKETMHVIVCNKLIGLQHFALVTV